MPKSEIVAVQTQSTKDFPAKIATENIVSEASEIINSVDLENQNQIVSTVKSEISISPKISAFSLSGLKAKKEFQEQSKPIQVHDENLPSDHFSETQMLLCWNEYAKKLGDKGQKIMESLLMMNVPILSNNVITLELPNQGSKLDFDAETPPLLLFLKQKLNNFSIEIQVIVNEQVEKKFAFTPEDKYNRLKELNPNLELLRKAFELDFA